MTAGKLWGGPVLTCIIDGAFDGPLIYDHHSILLVQYLLVSSYFRHPIQLLVLDAASGRSKWGGQPGYPSVYSSLPENMFLY